MNYWLLKSEPDTFSITDLAQKSFETTAWDGVRNFQARNFLRDKIKNSDHAFFYHSSCAQPGIAGIVKVVRESYPDKTQFDVKSPYFDPRSTVQNPRWFVVDIKLVEIFSAIITLAELRKHAILKNMLVLQKGNRLSVTPVCLAEWQFICQLRGK